MSEDVDGVYAGYMTGSDGTGFSMFVFFNGIISGVDPLGVMFDGSYKADETGYLTEIKVTVPSCGTVIQGVSTGPSGLTYNVSLHLLKDFAERDYSRVETPLGPVNLRLKKLRSLGGAE